MKQALLTLLCLFIHVIAKAQQEHTIKIDSRIQEVTVYLTGAEIRQHHELHLSAGNNRVIFASLSRHLQPQSVQVSINGDAEILSVSTASNFLNNEKSDRRSEQLNDSIDIISDAITDVSNRINAYKAEKAVLAANESIGGNQSGVSIVELQKALDFYRERTLKIESSIADLSKKLRALNTKLASAKKQLAEYNFQNNPERKEVTVLLFCKREQQTTILLRYLVANTGWQATYDLIAEDISKPVVLKYKANVYNNTGINWEQVKLKFSTADPSLSASKPDLTPWNLNYESKNAYPEANFEPFRGNVKMNLDSSVKYSVVAVSELSTEFEIEKPYDIPSDSKPYLIDVSSDTLPADYRYFAVPKIDHDAFLLAKVSGWERLNLIDGPANIYFGNSYIGQSMINTRLVEDTLDLSLGRDNRVLITRVRKEDFTSKRFFGTNRLESFASEIVMKNNRNVPIDIELQDQVPVSQESEIVVDVIEISGGELDDQSGRVKWQTHLSPGESKKYVIAFSIKYPKNRTVYVRHLKRMYCPSF